MDILIEAIRKNVLEYYELDINDAKLYFSTQNYAFVFPGKPNMIRVSLHNSKSKAQALSEAIWLDDLQQFNNTVCSATPSCRGKLIEEFELNGIHHRITMFRTAKGAVRDIKDVDPMYFISVGDCIGRIHAAGIDAHNVGFRFKRSHWSEYGYIFQMFKEKLPAQVYERMEAVFEKIKNMDEDPRCYGMIHGDFHTKNFFVDGNNIWPFDFDECSYGFFLYDVATVVIDWILSGYKADERKGCRKVLYEDILPYFKIGYELHVNLPEGHWDLLEIFMEYRASIECAGNWFCNDQGMLGDLSVKIRAATIPLMEPDLLEGYDKLIYEENYVPDQSVKEL